MPLLTINMSIKTLQLLNSIQHMAYNIFIEKKERTINPLQGPNIDCFLKRLRYYKYVS